MVRRLTFRELCERNPEFRKILTKMDSNWVKEDGPEMAVGNVLKTIAHNGAPFGKFADRGDSGAALKIVKPGVIEGTYGTLILRKNGTYKYKLYTEAENPAAYAIVQGLSDGETLREVFRYKVTNGFLKKASALKITVFGMDDEVLIKGLNLEGAEHVLDEADLPDGSNNGPMLPMVTGSFDVCARDGFKFLKIGGVTIIDANGVVAAALNTPIMTQYGELIITGVTQTAFDSYQIDYKYTLTDNTLDHSVKGPDSVLDSVVIELEDEDGSHATDSLDFEIKDDLPVAKLTLTGAMLIVDETDGVAADMNETDPLGGDLGMSMLTANQLFNE
ncbi:MAG: VCBS domain-containing protein, partial [Alphaproteobacteria bacterium]|nr:VCBS domain-containing protein [Alphaproteobacteria bacterium]